MYENRYIADPDYFKQKAKEYRNKNYELARYHQRQWYVRNREKVLAKAELYRKSTLETKIRNSPKPYIRGMSIDQYKQHKKQEALYNRRYYKKRKLMTFKKEQKDIILSFDQLIMIIDFIDKLIKHLKKLKTTIKKCVGLKDPIKH